MNGVNGTRELLHKILHEADKCQINWKLLEVSFVSSLHLEHYSLLGQSAM
jgi:hypothetical protein